MSSNSLTAPSAREMDSKFKPWLSAPLLRTLAFSNYFSPIKYLHPCGPISAECSVQAGTSNRSPA